MADTKTTQPVEGGAVLDALSKMFFKGIGSILDSAAEYQKEMGVLKQVSKIPVIDARGDAYTLIVKLSPIKDKENIYYVEVECPGYDKFNGEDVDKHAFTINKSTSDDFDDLIRELLKSNGLKRTDKSSDSTANAPDISGTFYADFYKGDDDSPYSVAVSIAISGEDNEIDITATGQPRLPKPFSLSENLNDADAEIGKVLNKHLESKCNLYIDAEFKTGWLQLVDLLNRVFEYADDLDGLAKEFNKIDLKSSTSSSKKKTKSKTQSQTAQDETIQEEQPAQEPAAASIQVRLEKITANGHEDINLVSILASTYDETETMSKIQEIVECDEFIDEMPEGESDYVIIDDGEYLDVNVI